MSDDEINRAIAEHIGARFFTEDGEVFLVVVINGTQYRPFTEDLNAMHEAEKAAFDGSEDLWTKYLEDELPKLAWANSVECSPARDRAKAFLRTVGKWKENE